MTMQTYTAAELQEVWRLHKLWLEGELGGSRADLRNADLRNADMRYADMRYAEMSGAEMSGADMQNAILTSANMRSADMRHSDMRNANMRSADMRHSDMRSADMRNADMRNADMRSADMRSADMRCADMRSADMSGALMNRAMLNGANMRSAVLTTGESWEKYLSVVVPALCQAGGQPLVAVADAWNCHEWSNCPMRVAFGVRDEKDYPLLLQPRVAQFVQLFDAGLIKKPVAVVLST